MDTIFALATPPGRSGVAVVRISGPAAPAALAHFGQSTLPEPRRATYHAFRITEPGKQNPEILDHGLILYFPAPHSFTGEDCIEFQIHGSLAVIRKILAELGSLPGFRQAEAGEFARRAFHHGKLDLTAAEGLADLIEAETEAQRRQALVASSGEAARYFDRLREAVMQSLALLEAYIDFPEEEIPESVYQEVKESVVILTELIEQSAAQLKAAEKIREGFTVVILGPPNAGKSTLLNALARQEVAIVSEQAGTTRDLIEVHLDIGGMPVVMIDTAGIRETRDSIETEGIRRALDRARRADLKLILQDATELMDTRMRELSDDRSLIVLTKCDLKEKISKSALTSDKHGSFRVSSLRPESFAPLLEAVRERLAAGVPGEEAAFVTHLRHQNHLRQAIKELRQCQKEVSLELQCERLRLAAGEIGKITGRIQVEELLGVIFSAFCIGK